MQIQCLIKEKEDKDRQNLMARFQMPPPVMDTKFVETMFSHSNILTTEAKNPDAMNDALSDSGTDFYPENLTHSSKRINKRLFFTVDYLHQKFLFNFFLF